MFGTLLESTRSRQSHAGFTVMSVTAHVALVVAAAAATTRAARPDDAPRPPEVIDIVFRAPEPVAGPRPVHRGTVRTDGAPPRTSVLPALDLPRRLIPPVGIPRDLPPIDITGGMHPEGTSSFPGSGHDGPIAGSYLGSGTDGGGALTADAVERRVALRVRAEPAYPAVLRRSGVEGAVRIRFVVDTLGRVELPSVEVRASAHDAFTEAVRAVLPSLRFAPARVAERPVRQLVEMPFVFSLRR